MELTGTTVLITGGAQGIGRGMARAFARAGAKLAIADIDARMAHETSEELAAAGAETTAVALDVRDRAAFERAVDDVEERLGAVDVLCNNAGIGAAVPVAHLTHDHWDQILEVNLGGVINGVQAVLPRILARGGPGYIVNTASGAGLIASTNLTYTTSKFAVVGMSESLRQQPELLAAGIGVTVLCPGLVRTDVLRNSAEQTAPHDDEVQERGQQILQQHGLDPDIVGEQVLAAVRTDQLHVQTDRAIEPLHEQRARLIADSLPPETERDRQLAPMVQKRAPSLTPPLHR